MVASFSFLGTFAPPSSFAFLSAQHLHSQILGRRKLSWFSYNTDDSSGETKSWETRRPSGRHASHRHRAHSKQVSWLTPNKLGSSEIRTQVGATSLFTEHTELHVTQADWLFVHASTQGNPWQEGIQVDGEKTLEWIKSGEVKRRWWSVLELPFQNSVMDTESKYTLYQYLIAVIELR